LFQEKRTFKALLLNTAFDANKSDSGRIVGLLNFDHPLLQLNAFASVGFFYRWR
jgi:hypothetical protein